MRNLWIAAAAVAFVFSSFTAVADGPGSDGGPVGAPPAPTGDALETVSADRMSPDETARVRGTEIGTFKREDTTPTAAYINSEIQSRDQEISHAYDTILSFPSFDP